MLRIIQNRSAAGAKSYYSQSDYYNEGQELIGHWGGKGSRLLGLSGVVGRREFERLCDNLDPRSGQRLTARTDTDRTIGYDFNFHVPKGVSCAFLLNRDERILESFQQSVRETMEQMEAEIKTRVRTRGRNEERTVGNLTWAEFIHTTARPVNGVPDPHLHAHCFVLNCVHDNVEKRFKAGQFRDVKRDAPFFEANFHARLAFKLRRLGYTIVRQGKTWDIGEIPRSVTTKFARRKDEIEALARKKGITDAAQKAELGAKTRQGKQKALSLNELRQEWLERLDPGEKDALRRSVAGARSAERRIAYEPSAELEALRHAVRHCFERESVVGERQLLAEGLRRGVGRVSLSGVEKSALQEGVIVRDFQGRRLATTREVLAEETSMLELARKGRQSAEPYHSNWQVRRRWLSPEQQAAVQCVLGSRDRTQVLVGGAGTGKTSLASEIREAIEASGKRVFAFAPSAEASEVLRSEGFERATTVAELLVNQKLQGSVHGQSLWIDEAGLLGTRDMYRVLSLANRVDARVILSGDWKQNSPVGRGAALKLLCTEGGLKPIAVSGIQRQKGEYRDAVAALARGDVLAGFDRLDRLGWVREFPEGERERQAASDYADGVSAGESMLAIASRRRDGDRLTREIRAELMVRGRIDRREHEITRLVPLHLTEAERADAANFQPGDVVIFHQNARGFKKGTRVILGEHTPASLTVQASRFGVFRPETIQLAKGDRLRITANGTTRDGHRLNNGATYEIAAIGEAGDIRLNNGWTIPKDWGLFDYGYCQTTWSSQGKTCDRVVIFDSADAYPAANRESFYVAASRGRKSLKLYVPDKTALRDVIQASSIKMTARELVHSREVVRRDAKRRRVYETIKGMIEASQKATFQKTNVHER